MIRCSRVELLIAGSSNQCPSIDKDIDSHLTEVAPAQGSPEKLLYVAASFPHVRSIRKIRIFATSVRSRQWLTNQIQGHSLRAFND